MPKQEPAPQPTSEVNYPPVENGVDYLDSVADHLRFGQPSPRNLKYAVLHLQAAAELLLKARLQQEHWSLVVKDPGAAKRDRFEAGDFDSCTTTGAIARLKDIAGVTVDDKSAKSLAILSKWRNALQHYGLKAPAPAVETRAAQVLDFLLEFIHGELLPALPGAKASAVEEDLVAIGMKVRQIKTFIDTRQKRLDAELRDVTNRTVECPFCGSFALVVGQGPLSPSCRFCHTAWNEATFAAAAYAEVFSPDAEAALQTCPTCSNLALVVDWARVLHATELKHLCFACGEAFDHLAQCHGCLDMYVPSPNEDVHLCKDCLPARLEKF